MEKFCRNCGAKLTKGQKFCQECGSPITGAEEKTAASAGSVQAVNIESPLPDTAERTGQPQKSEKPNKGIGKKLFALITAAVLCGGFFYAGWEKPGWFKKAPTDPYIPIPHADSKTDTQDDTDESEVIGLITDIDAAEFQIPASELVFAQGENDLRYQSADGTGVITSALYTEEEIASAKTFSDEVSPDDNTVSFENIAVDFGDYVIENETDTLTIKSLPQKTDSDNGFILSSWYVALDAQEECGFPYTMTVSYGDLGGRGPYEVLTAQRFNETLGRWEHCAFEINEDSRTVTVSSEKFGVFSLAEYMELREELPDTDDGEEDVITGDAGRSMLMSGAVQQLNFVPEDIAVTPLEQKELPSVSAAQSQRMKMNMTAEWIRRWSDYQDARTKLDEEYEEQTKLAANEDPGYYFNKNLGDIIFAHTGNVAGSYDLKISFPDVISTASDALKKSGINLPNVFSIVSVTMTSLNMIKDLIKAKSGYKISILIQNAPDYLVFVLSLLSACPSPISFGLGALLLARALVTGYCNGDFDFFAKNSSRIRLQNDYDSTYYRMISEMVYWDKQDHTCRFLPSKALYQKVIHPRTELTDDDFNRPYKAIADAYEAFGDPADNPKRFVRMTLPINPGHDFSGETSNKKGGGWGYLLDHIMNTYPTQPDKWLPEFENQLNLICRNIYNKGRYTITEGNLLSSGSDFGTLELIAQKFWYRDKQSELEKLKPTVNADNMKIRIMQDFYGQKIYKNFVEKARCRSDELITRNIQNIVSKSNTAVSFSLKNPSGNSVTLNDTKYAGKYVIWETAPTTYKLKSPWKVPKNQDGILNCTLFAWTMAGSPQNLLVYDSYQDYKNGKSPASRIAVRRPTVKNPNVTITVDGEPEQTTNSSAQVSSADSKDDSASSMTGDSEVQKPHHWKLVNTVLHQEDDSEDSLGTCVHMVSATEHAYRITATDPNLDPKKQYAEFCSTCSAPPAALKAGERYTFTLTDEISGTNDVNWHWGDYVAMTVDEPGLSYGMITVRGWNLPAAAEGGKNYCGMDVIGDFGEPPVRIPSAQVYLELPEGYEENEQLAVYFSGSQATTEWVYQWVPIG